MAMVLIIGPIFEVDLCEEQMGFRPGRDAKLAVRLVYYQVPAERPAGGGGCGSARLLQYHPARGVTEEPEPKDRRWLK
jgi:hypothetical protein